MMQAAVVDLLAEMPAVGVVESSWRCAQCGGDGCVDRDGSSGCGGVELPGRMQVVPVDASTETVAVGVVDPSCRVRSR